MVSSLAASLQTPEELDDSDFETEDFDVRSRTSVQTEDDQLIAGKSARVRLGSRPADVTLSRARDVEMIHASVLGLNTAMELKYMFNMAS